MAFKGVTFAGQNVTPKDDGALYMAHYSDGILDGCSMAISGDDLVIQSGHFIMGGRVVHVDGATNVDLSGRGLTTGYIQVIMNADLSQGEGLQWYTTFVESATTTFPTLTQDDINDTGTLYQVALAVVQISGGNLTSIVSEVDVAGLNITSKTGARVETVIEDDYSNLRTYEADGTIAGGFVAYGNGNYTCVYHNGGDILLRPNGNGVTTGQVMLDTNGQFHGGATLYSDYKGSESVSANATNVKVAQLDLPKGLYIMTGFIRHQASNGSIAIKRLGFSTVAGAFGLYAQTVLSNTTSAIEYNVATIWELTYAQTIYMNWGAFSTNGTITAHRFDAVKIA